MFHTESYKHKINMHAQKAQSRIDTTEKKYLVVIFSFGNEKII